MTLRNTLVGLLVACASGTAEPPASRRGPPRGAERTVMIPAGTFWMGCNAAADSACQADEKPQHEVELPAYLMDGWPVTVAEYGACVAAGACTGPDPADLYLAQEHEPWCTLGRAGDDHPINCVTWPQAAAYCAWVGARLPSEAEWEKAARGGCDLYPADLCREAMPTWPWGDDPATCDLAVLDDGGGPGCGEDAVAPVRTREGGRSPYGVWDMAGNVWEWLADGYDARAYDATPDSRRRGDAEGPLRVIRGGAFNEPPAHLRAGVRAAAPELESYRSVGFRCARSATLP